MMEREATYTGMYTAGWRAAGFALADSDALYDADRIHDLMRYIRALYVHTRERHVQAYLDGVFDTLLKRLQIADREA